MEIEALLHAPLTRASRTNLKLAMIAFSFVPLFMLAQPHIQAQAKTNGGKQTRTDEIQYQCPWSVRIQGEEPKTTKLTARIFRREPGMGGGVLKIFKDQELIFTHDPGFGLYPTQLSVLDDGNLATNWASGLGSYNHLMIFSYSKGKIRLALHVVSDSLSPEFVYQPSGHIMGEAYQAENGKWTEKGGPFFKQRILVPHVEWKVLSKPYLGGDRDKQPESVDIYTWNEKTRRYAVHNNVPWLQRFNEL